ncbi:hypothetical protein CR513_51130, partial [Mucuna pruriens]
MEWNPDCQEAFEKIKKYLENPLVLVLVVPRRPLILYLTVLGESMGLQKEIPSTRIDLLHFGLGSKKAETVHVG